MKTDLKISGISSVAGTAFGGFIGMRGPTLFHIIPVVDTVSCTGNQRVRVANVSAESPLTRDTVPVNVGAIVFCLVWEAKVHSRGAGL